MRGILYASVDERIGKLMVGGTRGWQSFTVRTGVDLSSLRYEAVFLAAGGETSNGDARMSIKGR